MSPTECRHGNYVVDEICGHCWQEVVSALRLCIDAIDEARSRKQTELTRRMLTNAIGSAWAALGE